MRGAGESGSLQIGFLGRIPPALGGAGLELQMERTRAALERRGHEVFHVEAGGKDDRFDLLHAFGSEPAVWHHLRHWSRNPAPLIVTSVLVVSPGRRERMLRLSTRVPGVMGGGRMRAEVLRRANAVVAGTEYERNLATGSFGADPQRTVVIGNGAERVEPGALPEGVPDSGYALLLGSVSRRKRQASTMEALAAAAPVVIAGAFDGDAAQERAWEAAVRKAGATWLGHVGDAAALAALQHRAGALVHLSEAEVESLAVLECLAQGTPAVLSDIPSHRALARRYPGFIELAGDTGSVPAAFERIRAKRLSEPAQVPSWEDVAAELEALYRRVLRHPRGR